MLYGQINNLCSNNTEIACSHIELRTENIYYIKYYFPAGCFPPTFVKIVFCCTLNSESLQPSVSESGCGIGTILPSKMSFPC